MAVYTYSSKDVSMSFGGITLENWDSISVTRSNPSFRPIQGIRGKNTRVKMSDTSANIEIVVPLTSEMNYIFIEILRQDELTGNARISMMVKDNSGAEVFSTYDAYITGSAVRDYGKEVPTRTWTLACQSSEMSPSSNAWGIDSILTGIRDTVSNLF